MGLKKEAILSISLLTVMTSAAVAPVLSHISAAFPNAGITIIRLTLTLPALVAIFFNLISGALALHVRKTLILKTGLILYALGGTGAALVQNINGLLAMRAILGMGAGLIAPLTISLIADFYEGEERVKLIGYSASVAHLAAVLMPLLAGWLAVFNWRLSFLIYLLAIGVLIFTSLFLKDPPKAQSKTKNEKSILPASVYWLSLNSFLLMMVFYIIPTSLSHFIEGQGLGGPAQAGIAISLSTLATLFISLFFSQLVRILKRYIWTFGLLFLAVGFWGLSFSGRLMTVFISVSAIGIGLGALIPGIILTVTLKAPSNASSTAIAIANSAFSLGQFLSPIFFSLAESFSSNATIRYDYSFAAALISLAVALSLISVLLMRDKNSVEKL
ncbi:MAG TPA: MFS transporter [Anaerolineae bacterium]|nr:MFS transporter [Anaerolineae bacterium]